MGRSEDDDDRPEPSRPRRRDDVLDGCCALGCLIDLFSWALTAALLWRTLALVRRLAQPGRLSAHDSIRRRG
ncbi:MAG: hypothetical protein AAGD18_03065 [Actinomycetota bacterium]